MRAARDSEYGRTEGPRPLAGAWRGMGTTRAGLRRRLGAAIAALAAFAALLGVVPVAGAAFSPPVTLSKPGATAPQIASDADGDAVAVWSNSENRVRARTISAAGVLGPVPTLSAAGQSVAYPQIASDADGDAVAVWRGWDAGSDYRIQARQISAAGTLGAIETLSGYVEEAPQIASDADGDAVAVWLGFGPGLTWPSRRARSPPPAPWGR